jgi:hypothetical protein
MRIRTRTGNPPPLIAAGSRPPDALLPPPFVALVGEYDAVSARYYGVERVINDFRATWDVQLAEAKEADGKANARAARLGEPIGTSAADALLKARADADADLVSLTAARDLVANDFFEVLSSERDGDTYDKSLAAARVKLAKAAAQMQAAISEAVRAKSVHEWVGGLPFDGSESVLAEAVVPGLLVGDSRPTPAATIVAALVQITD